MTSDDKKRRSRFDVLSEDLSKAPVDLLAYKLAKKVFWMKALEGNDETFDEVYARIRALLRRLGPTAPNGD